MTQRKTLLVTGASSGIGAAVAKMAARDGWDIGIGYHSDRAGAETVAHAVTDAGGKALLLPADMRQPDQITAMFQRFDAEFDRLDGLVNNAGIVDQSQRVDEMSPDRLTRMFETNVVGPMLCAKEAVLRMAHRHGGAGGVIVNMSSVAARLGSGGQYVDYAASKAAIDCFTKGLAQENADQGIRVNSIRPGIIETPIHAKGGQPGREAELAHLIPMQRPGSAEEVAEAVLWLLSDRASYVTGSMIDVSGGR